MEESHRATAPTVAMASLIIDTTYRCNARCRYCRWGDGRTSQRQDVPPAGLCLPPELLRAAGVTRVVLSGGEPLLHPGLPDVLAHYAAADVRERVVITNGLNATGDRLESCRLAGATGFAFSIDAIDGPTALATRAMSNVQIDRVLAHLAGAGRAAAATGMEVTVNCVLSAANCSVEIVRRLALRATACGASAIKFQPVFDDGYLGNNAPGLRLSRQHATVVRAIAADAPSWGLATNPGSFFADLAAVCEGRALDGASCGLSERTLVLQAGGIVVCPWIGARPARTTDELPTVLRDFRAATTTCGTGAHCFCLQPRDHAWGFRHADG